ncbi:CAF17-like 4Fe-4S cluster assembly/insertion protein YgfZ [Acuticoccus mangrovi]|uniref:Folate-binding protein YgfZ n=1 Tax=Acuticoccus mangrovi TaxID=2796142 RepID=A0A934MI19_9HYPH|nr:folate-binding protein YgfZ [Acuticoccus mangrovi]MBJ3778288.1 folate-binding protein YgfZ [Acuticoccus mangrovi]
MTTTGCVLERRVAIRFEGPDRVKFLDGLLSADVEAIAPGGLGYGALLTPQGKILSDMMIHVEEDHLTLDVPTAAADDLERRFGLYKLRAAVTLARTDEVVVVSGEGPADPRAAGLGGRTLMAPADAPAETDASAYHAARIAAGVPDAVLDFELGDAFPHDANMDLTGGVDFKKGCFVGQEVVSRMRHRGTARRRTVIVAADATLPATGAPVTVGGKVVGRLGTTLGGDGLAVVRIDRVGETAEIEGVAVRLRVPPGAPFALKVEEASD